jgi:hypothetical protein
VLWWSFPAGSIVTFLLAGIYYRYSNWRAIGMLTTVVEEEAREQAQADGEPGGRLNPVG